MKFKVACVQQMANDITDYCACSDHIVDLIGQAADQGAQVIVIPECAYPSYFVGVNPAVNEQAIAAQQDLIDRVQALSQVRKVCVALGMSYSHEGKLYNAVLFFEDGVLRQTTAKSNLWHMDGKWFTPGREYEVFDTRLGRFGMIICADGRVPEISRILAKKGAQLILDPVNLVSTGRDRSKLSNQQCDFMLPCRAYENGVWYAVSNKCGVEEACIIYAGNSMIIDPTGKVVARADSEHEQIIIAEVETTCSFGPLVVREFGLSAELGKPAHETAAYQRAESSPKGKMGDYELYACVAKCNTKNSVDYLSFAVDTCHRCQLIDCGLLVLPPAPEDLDCENLSRAIAPLLKGEMVVVTGCGEQACAIARAGILKQFERGSGELLSLAYGNLGVVFDEDMIAPEIARAMMLKGCDLLVWLDHNSHNMDQKVLQTRSAENKFFVLRSANAADAFAAVGLPTGAVGCCTLQGENMATGMSLFTLDAWSKTVVPGTDVVRSRPEEGYPFFSAK